MPLMVAGVRPRRGLLCPSFHLPPTQQKACPPIGQAPTPGTLALRARLRATPRCLTGGHLAPFIGSSRGCLLALAEQSRRCALTRTWSGGATFSLSQADTEVKWGVGSGRTGGVSSADGPLIVFH
ncbi:unnamed protein product [Boreogadus saida]